MKLEIALLVLVAGCAGTAPPPASAPAVVVAEPSAAPEPEAEPEAQAAPPEALTGIADCDEYLELYRSCEPKLAGDIAAGQRRSHGAERGWLIYMKSSSEAPGMPATCRDLLRELRPRCS